MKTTPFLVLTLLLTSCVSERRLSETQKYYNVLEGNTYYQISNPDILARGDTMVFSFSDSVYMETGFSYLFKSKGSLHNNSKYEIDCKTNPCSIMMTHFKYDSLGNELYDSTYLPYRGRIELLTDSTFRVRFITDHMNKRPITFEPEDHRDIVIFETKN